MTAHLRELRRTLTAFDTTTLPGVWPERIGPHITSIAANLERAIANLGALAYTPREPDYSREPDPKNAGRTPHRDPAATAARLATGPQRTIDSIDTDLTIAVAHLRAAYAATWPPHIRDHCRLAWHRLGDARSTIEKHAGIGERKSLLLCACGGMPGYLEWGNQLCENVAAPDRAGLCIPCSLKRDAWRKRRDRRAAGGRPGQRAGTPA